MPHDGSRIEPHFDSDELWTEETLKPLSTAGVIRTPLSGDHVAGEPPQPRRRDRVMLVILSALAVLGSATALAASLLL